MGGYLVNKFYIMKRNYTICVIGGDGIGPEVVEETLKVLKEINLNFNFISAEAGFAAYQKYGTSLPKKTIELCKKADAVLFGAVTTPPNINNYSSAIINLRKTLDTYANVRPFLSLPLESIRKGINLVIIRENTEDLYCGKERKTVNGAIAERIITKKASERIIKFAFQFALKEKRKKVTIIHKANVLRLTDGLFLKIGHKIAKNYPEIIFDDLLVDAAAMKLIKRPEEFDVIVTTNMFGDILSDEVAGLVGGLGIAASANIGKKSAVFEPVHGSAPKYAGKNIANPTASFFSAVMMLEYFGEERKSKQIKKAIINTIKKGIMTKDLGGESSMSYFTNKVIQSIKENN